MEFFDEELENTFETKEPKPKINSAVITNRMQAVSRIFTSASRDTSVFEENILVTLVSVAQEQIKGIPLKRLVSQYNIWGDVELTFRLSDLTERNNYKNYRNAFRNMTSNVVCIEHNDGSEIVPMFQRVYMKKNSVDITALVPKAIWDGILDFSKRASYYTTKIAFNLPTPYSKRIYMMIAYNVKPVKLSIERINKMFQTNYKANDIVKRILEPSKHYMDTIDNADYSFDYHPYTEEIRSGRGRKRILGWELVPRRIANVKAEEAKVDSLVRSGTVKRTPKAIRNWLIENMDFTNNGLDNIDKRLAEYAKRLEDDWQLCFDSIKCNMVKARSKREIKNPQGYFVESVGKWIERNKPMASGIGVPYGQTDSSPDNPTVAEPEVAFVKEEAKPSKESRSTKEPPKEVLVEKDDELRKIQQVIMNNLKNMNK